VEFQDWLSPEFPIPLALSTTVADLTLVGYGMLGSNILRMLTRHASPEEHKLLSHGRWH
jgi:hypothetical protein